jgi:TetR/AcrR family transcriptional regulator, cholesterol catabolism regulator
MTPRQRARRDRLIEAALALLEEDDYEQVQVKDVADRAGVSLGTLYNYFSSK